MIYDFHHTWVERGKGKQQIIKTFGKAQGFKLVGYLNYETGQVYFEEHVTYDVKSSLSF